MAHNIAVLSAIPRLSYHLRSQLPNLTITDVVADKNDTLSTLNKADILIADCDLLMPYACKLQSVKWVQTTWAGIEHLASNLRNKDINYKITRFSDKAFGFAMSEYVIAQIYNFERDQRQQFENQKHARWSQEGRIQNHRLIRDLNVGILGLGNIGKSIAQKLKEFGATVWGMTRTTPKENFNYLDEHRTTEFLPEILQNCDYVVNVLPSTKNTIGLLNGTMLENCKNRGSVFINIGRGTIIGEGDLLNALEKKWISGAVLDVFEKEPLSRDSKLWSLQQVIISPHISGVTRPQDVARLFVQNYHKFVNGETMLNTFNQHEGY